MKSQSLIGRVKPELATTIGKELGSFKKNLSYFIRYHRSFLQYFGLLVLATGSATLLIVSAVQSHHQDIADAAKAAHYSVGQTIVCNLSQQATTHDDGWHSCKITAISKDKTHYTVEFQSPDAHRTITYSFSVLDVGTK